MNTARLTFVHALSPLHAGTGQGVGVIDLPIAREKATNLPFLPGSQLKGTMRDECDTYFTKEIGKHETDAKEIRRKVAEKTEPIFGPDKVADDSAYAGSAVFTDQRLLCLPVRSLFGTFAWVTSPFILERLGRDAANIDVAAPAVPKPNDEQICIVFSDDCQLTQGDDVILEDLKLTVQNAEADAWATWIAEKVFPNNVENMSEIEMKNAEAWQKFFRQRFCIVHDDVMNFLAETATEVTARNRLGDDTKTTVKGALWYEESLPSETILSGLLVAVKVRGSDSQTIFDTLSILTKKPVHLGGGMTVGRGLCQVRLSDAPTAEPNGGN